MDARVEVPTMPEAGWYDDPQGGGGKRWWDGQRWSEHTTPAPGSIPPAAAMPPAPPGAPPGAQIGGGWQAGAAGIPATPGAQPTPKKGGAGKIVALILGLVVVVGIGVVVVLLLTGSDDPEVVATEAIRGDDPAMEDPAVDDPAVDDPAVDDPAVDDPGGTSVPDTTVDVPENGTFETEVDLPAGLVVIDVRGVAGFDPVLALYDSAGNEVARNDDRSSDQATRYGGGFYDSLIETEIPAGQYRVEIRGFASEGGQATLAFPVVGG